MSTVIWWLRRDLRLHDNQAFEAALASGQSVIPLFVLDESLLKLYAASAKRIAFMLASLRSLDESLRQRGSYLVVRKGNPVDVLPAVVRELGATAVFVQGESDPYGRERDRLVAERVPLTAVGGLTIRPLGSVEKKAGGPYTVFTPYKRMWLSQPLPRQNDLFIPPDQIKTPENILVEPLPDEPLHGLGSSFPASETAARDRLVAFAETDARNYGQKRDAMALSGTSSLSPYFAFGLVSAREAAVLALATIARERNQIAREGAEVWLSELIWREFYHNIQYEFPHVRERNFRADYDGIAWHNDEEEFRAWCDGRTGYPVVDAAMRQMNETGWMHNRARMIVASFLIKDLLIDWRWGEHYFMEKLIDGEGAANNGGWQWAAGTGTDAAPYFRIFNPISQSKKFDAQGEYIRRWVPELATLDNKHIHAPWEMPPLIQRSVGVVIGEHYPRPIIDHKFARERTLAAYKTAKAKPKTN